MIIRIAMKNQLEHNPSVIFMALPSTSALIRLNTWQYTNVEDKRRNIVLVRVIVEVDHPDESGRQRE